MTRTTNTNYSAADATLGDIAFQVADSDNDLFDRFDVAKMGKALDVHTHDGAGKGLVTASLAFGAVSQHVTTGVASGQTTTSAVNVDIDAINVSVTITPTVGTRLLVQVAGSVVNNTAAAFTVIGISQDGVTTEYWVVSAPLANMYGGFGGTVIGAGTAGVATTFRLKWRVSSGTATLQRGQLSVVELKK